MGDLSVGIKTEPTAKMEDVGTAVNLPSKMELDECKILVAVKNESVDSKEDVKMAHGIDINPTKNESGEMNSALADSVMAQEEEEKKFEIKKEHEDSALPRNIVRYRMDAVVVPRLPRGTKRPLNEPASVKLEVKKIKLERSEGLAAGTLSVRLNGIETYPTRLDFEFRDLSFSRQFVSDYYGGSVQETFPKAAAKFYTLTGYRHFMYPSLVVNPESPRIPGEPGLFLNPQAVKPPNWTEEYNLLTRLAAKKFQYMGKYTLQPSQPLSLAEWLEQEPTMRHSWATRMATKGWGREVRSRIDFRRRLDREPNDDEAIAELETSKQFTHITAADILNAYNSGDELLSVWTMKCIGYDEQFQRGLADPQVLAPPPKSTRKSGRTTRKKGKRVKRSITPKSEDEDESNEL
ncbi:hypothetical protein FB45DRAFT_840252 [Roridomyces roridus]|uniref:DUF6697 domain-containing protein n=1 Tax=Roridomyces roridus TaxID=1738132 RepID=A0AAD7BEA9_9AGAR|nr:hypothetical protein FB45DRAFT_840252 [Roridomyces roridus]